MKTYKIYCEGLLIDITFVSISAVKELEAVGFRLEEVR